MENIHNKPCLIQTAQGFSVSYNNKLLYSKYNPSRAILQSIEKLQLLPGTILLCLSPVLPYGLKELSQKLPENCVMLGVEFDSELLNFINSNMEEFNNIQSFSFLTQDEACNLGPILTKNSYELKSGFKLGNCGTYKRILPVEFSAGVQLHSELYNQFVLSCVNAIKTVWANRITLNKFGRKYCQHIFKNLKVLKETTPISAYFEKVDKPVLVFGAGESTDKGIKEIKETAKNYFILCADTALGSLIKNGIIPDGVFVEEAQQVISKAFIGLLNNEVQIFAGLSSLPLLNHIVSKNRLSYFLTDFSSSQFLDNLKSKDFITSVNQPLGSVGLTAVYYALKFRKNNSVPVYIYGLDFSYSAGRTHAKGTMAQELRLITSSRLKPAENYNSSFNKNSIRFLDKKNNIFYTSPVMQNYANLFNGLFSSIPALYDSSECGIKLNIPDKKPDSVNPDFSKKAFSAFKTINFSVQQKENITNFLTNEKSALEELKNLLTGKTELEKEKITEKITELLNKRDYLYLHFPDAHQFTLNQSFLNRIRTEIDFYLKILN